MGFIIMLLFFICGIFLVSIGIIKRKQSSLYQLNILLGIFIICVAIYMARPH